MSLKIHEIRQDHTGARLSGLFDGEPFHLVAEGGKWLFRTAKGWTHAEEALNIASTSEARSAAYGAVAQFRNAHRFA